MDAEHEGKGYLYAGGEVQGVEYDTKEIAKSQEFFAYNVHHLTAMNPPQGVNGVDAVVHHMVPGLEPVLDFVLVELTHRVDNLSPLQGKCRAWSMTPRRLPKARNFSPTQGCGPLRRIL